MYKIIVKNKKHWDSIIEDVKPNILGLGIDDYKGHYFFGKYTPESYPFILIRGEFKEGYDFDHEQFLIIYPEDFEREWEEK